jgi:transcriptional regulator with XRE-family HTH domain
MGQPEETEEFAAYLRRLKDRSGRSYGQLAQRAHLSTSTLHRYCHGKAVPVEYAPVERLARLCGAKPEELVQLHRRWVRADAQRMRAAAGGGAAGAEDAPATEATEATEDAEERPARTSPARGWRRWVWPVAALLALAVTVAVSTFVADGPPESPGGRGRDAAPGGERQEAGAEVSASPSASAKGAKPSAGTSQAAPDAARPERSEAGGEPGSASPLSWTVRAHEWRHGCAHHYLIDREPSEVPPPPVEQDARPWATSLGAVHGGDTVVEATVRAAGTDPVVVEGVYVRVVDRRAPLAWPAYAMSNGCGGALTPAAFTVDLDAERPVARPQDGYDGEDGTHLPATRLPYQVSAGDPLVLRIEAAAKEHDCDWYVEVRWSSAGRSGTLRIDDGGRPFRTSGTGGGPEYGYDWSAGKWSLSGD